MIWHRVRAQEADPMMYDKFFADAISRLRDDRRYRVFADLERIAGRFPWAVWHSPRGLGTS
jgi:5-aminolevulinate synthase